MTSDTQTTWITQAAEQGQFLADGRHIQLHSITTQPLQKLLLTSV